MKKILLNALLIGALAGAVNFGLALLLGESPLETPFIQGTEEFEPASDFAMKSLVGTVVLTLIGGLILGLLHRRYGERSIRIWRIVGIAFLFLYGAMPFLSPGVATAKAGLLINILHFVAGFAALHFLPRATK
ncbi:MAG: DUF6069 family protein [Bacteroidota bacterium]